MVRSHQAKENKRLERIAQNHPDNSTDRCYEYARIKKLENRVLNTKEKHVLKMRDSIQGSLVKLNEELLKKSKVTKITKRSKHVHPDDMEKIQSTDLGGDVPYFQSSGGINTAEQTIDAILDILSGMTSEEIESGCKNPKISRIVQNVIRHSTEENMRTLINILFDEKKASISRQGDDSDTKEGLCFEASYIAELFTHPHDKLLHTIARAVPEKVPNGGVVFVNLCSDNYASFIISTMVRRATHSIFKTILYKYCIPYLPLVLNHKPVLRVIHWLFINRFCGKKERNDILNSLLIAAIGIHRGEINDKALARCSKLSIDTPVTDFSDLIDREGQWWENMKKEERDDNGLYVYSGLIYLCQLFADKLPKSAAFPVFIVLLKRALLINSENIGPSLLEKRKEMVSTSITCFAGSMGALFTSSVAMSQEWSEKTFTTLSLLFKEASDEQMQSLVGEMAPHASRLLGFVNKRGRYGSQRMFCAMILRCAHSDASFIALSTLLKHILHSESYTIFRKGCVEVGTSKRRQRKNNPQVSGGLEAPGMIDSLAQICQLSLRLINKSTSAGDSLEKSFFSQYLPESFSSLSGNDQTKRAFLTVLALTGEIRKLDAQRETAFLHDALNTIFQQITSKLTTENKDKWVIYAEKMLDEIKQTPASQ